MEEEGKLIPHKQMQSYQKWNKNGLVGYERCERRSIGLTGQRIWDAKPQVERFLQEELSPVRWALTLPMVSFLLRGRSHCFPQDLLLGSAESGSPTEGWLSWGVPQAQTVARRRMCSQ